MEQAAKQNTIWGMYKPRVNPREYRQRVLALLETEVKLYHETKQRLAEMTDDVIWENHKQLAERNIKSPGRGDPTAKKSMLLYSNAVISSMDKMVRAIERARDEFCQQDTLIRLRFLHLRFWDNKLTPSGIATELQIGESTVYKWRGDFLELVAGYLGWRMVP